MGIADDVIKRYQEGVVPSQDTGLADRVISRFREQSQITPPKPEAPQGIFSRFTDYVKKNSVQTAQGNFMFQGDKRIKEYGDLNLAQKFAGAAAAPAFVARDLLKPTTLNKVGRDFTFGVGDLVGYTAEAINYQLFGGKEKIANINKQRIANQKKISELLTSKDLDQKTKDDLLRIAKNQAEPFKASDMYDFATKTHGQIAGTAIGALADILTFGTGSAGLKTALSKKGVKPLIKFLASKEGFKFLGKESIAGAATFGVGGFGEGLQEQERGAELYQRTKRSAITGAFAQPSFAVGAGVLGKAFGLGAKNAKTPKIEKIEPKKENKFDIFKAKNEQVDLSNGKITPKKETTKLEVTKPKERDIDKIIKDSGFVDYTIRPEKKLSTLTGGKAQGRARYDFKTGRGIIEVAKEATPTTKAHEFAHVVNRKLGEGQEKFSTELNQFINGKRTEPPKSIIEYAKRNNENPVNVAKELAAEMRKVSRLGIKDSFRSAVNPSEEFSNAVANTLTKDVQAAPQWSKFLESEVLKAKKVKPVEIKPVKTTRDLARDYIQSGKSKFREPTASGEALSKHVQTMMKRLDTLKEGTASYKSTVKAIRKAENEMVKERIKNPKFRLKDDFKKATGIEITNKQEKQIMALNKKIFGDTDVKITGQIFDNKKALGKYEDRMIEIVGGKADMKDTFYHESVHKYIDVFTTEDEAVDLLEAAQKRYGIKIKNKEDFAKVEERLAEDFIKYAKNREGMVGKIKGIFDSVLNRFEKFSKNKDEVDKLYSDIISGKAKKFEQPKIKPEVIKETKKTVRVKAPAKVTEGGAVKKEIEPIKSVSIRTDKLNTSDDVKQFIDKFSTADKSVIDRQRRGKITNTELDELASMTGLKPDDIMNAQAGSIVNAENAVAARRMMATMAEEITDLVKNFPISPSKNQLLDFRDKMNKFRGVQKAIAGFRSEAGRLLQSYRTQVIAEEYDVYDDMIKAVSKIDKSEASSIQKAVKMGELSKPDKMWELAIKAGMEARTAWLLYNPTTHAANFIGNTTMAVKQPVQKWLAEIIGKGKGVVKGETETHIRGMQDAIPEAFAQLKKDLVDVSKNKEISGFATKSDEVTRERKVYELIKRFGVPENIADKTDSMIKTSFKLLTAGDNFFRTINSAGELYSQALRKATKEGLTGQNLKKRVESLIDNPLQDQEFVNEIVSSVDTLLFQEKLPDWVNKITLTGKETVPSALFKIFISPFRKTPYNILREAVRTSPLGFLRPALAKVQGKEMNAAAKSLSQAQATVGTIFSGIAMYGLSKGRLTAAAPRKAAEREEFYASGKQPYSIKVGDTWWSYRRVEPLANAITLTANAYQTATSDKDFTEKMVEASMQFSQSFTDQTFMKGASDMLNAVTDPERYGKTYFKNTITSFMPFGTGLGAVARAEDPLLRETEGLKDKLQAMTPTQSKKLPAKIDIFGREVEREGTFAGKLLMPFKKTTEKPNATIKALEESSYNLSTFRLDEIKGVKLDGKAKEAWLKIVGQTTKKELDRLVESSRFKRMNQSEKDDALKDTVTKVRADYRKKASFRLKRYFDERSKLEKTEQKKFSEEEIKGRLEQEIFKIR